ncbi:MULTISPECIES: ABC transporter permease [unclassified Mesorhizobium]|uniref:ABC transporter permease n=1 Tax=unclassified Mesorhizobium TaxID=325217 RepID=UPI000FE8F4A6|nr:MULTISPECIES: ABC transporter permease [unclassified Mesorhizobium]RWI23964.1 MAG: ABC transporter permease [Mesorhizobium sp.]RWK51513.1 MAG: ABC transporter permease [Mesorhizobium sp.]RWK96178.1 MAG: ABC transporter permease [Mesorhizobium sp.]TIP59835.1 MAG: ABC transporter permease [Mesorhizobium sp.]TIQ21987.1 MAG: ABC transporter permease [Mesorhizobium sp.]
MTGGPSPDTLPARPLFNWRDFFRRAGWLESVGIIGVPVVTVVAVLAPWITPFDPQLRVAGAYLPPSAGHWFGTDEIGRDLFSRVILGAQYTWLPALAVIGFSLTVGTLVGLISGLVGDKVDLVIQRIVDLFLVLPATLIALAVVASLGPGLGNTMIAIAIVWWPWYARISRDEIRRLKARPHVEAARIAGVRGPRLLLRYLLPGVVPALLIGASLDVANIVMTLSLMSFLGLGLPAPTPELGAMTSRTLDSLTIHWWLPILPAAIIFLLCLLANLAGDGIRAALRGA